MRIQCRSVGECWKRIHSQLRPFCDLCLCGHVLMLSEDSEDGEVIGCAGPEDGSVVAVELGGIDDVVHAASEGDGAVAPAPGWGAAIELRKGVREMFFGQPIHHRTAGVVVEIPGDDSRDIRPQAGHEALHFIEAFVTGAKIAAHAETAAIGYGRAEMHVEHLHRSGRGLEEANPGIKPAAVGRDVSDLGAAPLGEKGATAASAFRGMAKVHERVFGLERGAQEGFPFGCSFLKTNNLGLAIEDRTDS
jgi:hypothetical protein